MARSNKSVFLSLDRLTFDRLQYAGGGGGIGGAPSVTPYLWTIFFVADGTNIRLDAGGKLSGAVAIMSTVGTREDLGGDGLQVGQGVPIDRSLGALSTVLRPIPVDPSLQPMVGDDLPGMFGAVVVLMEQNGYLTDDLARVGENALNAYVAHAIAQLAGSLGPTHMTITQDDIDQLTAGAADAVKGAIKDALSWWQEVEIFFDGTDQEIGHTTLLFTQDDFPGAADTKDITQPIGEPYNLWGLHGSVTVMDPCAANSSLLSLRKRAGDEALVRRAEEGIQAMRHFRDSGALRRAPTAAWWWEVASRHSAEISRLVEHDGEIRGTVAKLFAGVSEVVVSPEKPIPAALLGDVEIALSLLRAKGSPVLARTALQASAMARKLHGKSFQEAETMFAAARRSTPRRGGAAG